MTMLAKTNQSGRSMVEMLGVLAIIGVLSVGGISGYSKAMAKFKLTKAQDQITMLLMNIRTAFATSPSYDGLTTANAISYNIAPSDMISGKTTGSGEGATTTTTLFGAFGGEVTVNSCDQANVCQINGQGDNTAQYFYITMADLGREACMSLASSDWGSDGLVGIKVGTGGGKAAHELPYTLADAATDCVETGADITWVYY